MRDEMKLFGAIENLLKAKNDQYGQLSSNPTHRWLCEKFPHFRVASAIKHLVAYARTGSVEELVKAGAYVALEYEESMRKRQKKMEVGHEES